MTPGAKVRFEVKSNGQIECNAPEGFQRSIGLFASGTATRPNSKRLKLRRSNEECLELIETNNVGNLYFDW